MASFSTPFIRRPVATIMLNAALVVFGLLGLQRLPVRELPDIDPPIVNVLTVYPGASAEVVETEITEKLEDVIAGVEQIKSISSTSREQASSITIEFNQGHNLDVGAQDVRDQVSRIRGDLPDDMEDPVISKEDANASPIIWIAFFSDRYDTEQLTRIADDQVRDRLQTVPGVSSIILGGEKRRAIRLWLDPMQMASRNITLNDVQGALENQNVELPSGRLESHDVEMAIQTKGQINTPSEFARLIIKQRNGHTVYLADIGDAEWGVEDERSIARFTGRPSIGLGVVRQSRANTLEVAAGVKAMMDELASTLPAGIEYRFPYDQSIFVERAVTEVWLTLGIAFVLVVLTIFVFLRSFRSTLLPALAIPISIIATFGGMYAMGYSINIFTLLALVLAIGLVVDDAIVVLENIYRHIEEGKSPEEAAHLAMGEISFAVIATTLSLISVFLPLTFIGGVTGRLLLEFAVALSFSVVLSSIVALTLTPMAAAKILRPIKEEEHGKLYACFERGFDSIAEKYDRLLNWSLHHRLTVILVAVVSLVLSGYFYTQLEREFLPEEDKGRMIAIGLTPQGSTPSYSDRMVRQMETVLQDTPEVDTFFTAVALPFNGPGDATQSFIFVRLKSGKRAHIRDIIGGPAGIGARFWNDVEGAIAIPIMPKAVDLGFSQPFQLVIQHPHLKTLDKMASDLTAKLNQSGFLANVRPSFELNKPEVRVTFNRDRAGDLGISLRDVSRTLQVLFGGQDLSDLKIDGKQYDVIAQLRGRSRMTPEDLDALYVRAKNDALIPLSNVVTLETQTGPNQIDRFQRQRAVILEGTPQGVPLGTAVDKTEALLAEHLPADASYSWKGEAEDLQESSGDMRLFFLLAIVIVYMVLAAQFESFIHPFTVMLSLPLAFLGAFALLYFLSWVNVAGNWLYGLANYAEGAPEALRSGAGLLSHIVPRISSMNLNIFSQVGLILLVGLVTKNSILLVEFANQLMEKGETALDAMRKAGATRLRPILMTSTATIMGILPIAIGFGDAAESRRPLGVVAVGGMLTSTILTLIVIPVIYTFFASLSRKKKQAQQEGEAS